MKSLSRGSHLCSGGWSRFMVYKAIGTCFSPCVCPRQSRDTAKSKHSLASNMLQEDANIKVGGANCCWKHKNIQKTLCETFGRENNVEHCKGEVSALLSCVLYLPSIFLTFPFVTLAGHLFPTFLPCLPSAMLVTIVLRYPAPPPSKVAAWRRE